MHTTYRIELRPICNAYRTISPAGNIIIRWKRDWRRSYEPNLLSCGGKRVSESWADQWLQQHLVCPRDQQSLRAGRDRLVCPQAHEYPVVNGVPVMLWDDASQNIGAASLREARKQPPPDPWFVDAIPCNAEEYELVRKQIAAFQPGAVDPVVQSVLTITNGNLYRPLLGRLRE